MSRSTTENDESLQARALNRVVRAETWRRERIVNHFRFALFSLIGLAEWAERSGQDHTHLTVMPFVFLSWGVIVEIFNLTWIRRQFKSWMPAALTTIDITVLTIAMRIIYGHALQYDEPTLREIDRAMVGLLVLVAANIIRFSWRTSIWSGVCALVSLGYLRIYSNTLQDTAILTDFLVFAAVVALLVYANRSFRTVTERLIFDLRKVQQQRLSSLRALVAGVTHEINSPLGAISGNVQLTQRAAQTLEELTKGDEPGTRRALDGLKQAGDGNLTAITRISSIIGALGDFARIDDTEVRQVDIRHDIDTCVTLLSTEAGDRIEFVRQYTEPLEITCRPAQLNQVFMHVLRNAVQSIEGSGCVTVSGTREAEAICIEVADTGRGIPKRNLDGIFDLQFGRKGERVGMGLGLPISHNIVQDHAGTIEVKSTVGAGTTVTIRLPTG